MPKILLIDKEVERFGRDGEVESFEGIGMGEGLEEGGEAGDDADDGEDEDDDADDAVDPDHGARAEVGAELVDEERYEPPPTEGTGYNTHVTNDIVIPAHIWHKEAEAGEESDYQEEYQGIRECEKESGEDVFLG